LRISDSDLAQPASCGPITATSFGVLMWAIALVTQLFWSHPSASAVESSYRLSETVNSPAVARTCSR
jgi:hypothetical protein